MAKDKGDYKFTPDKGGEGKKTVLLIAILLVLIVIVGAGLVYIITHKAGFVTPPANGSATNASTTPSNQTNATQNGTAGNVTCADQCHLANALRDGNASECQLVTDAALAQDCYSQLSGTSLAACELLSNETRKEACLIQFAVAMNDSSLCDLFSPASKGGCLSHFNPCVLAKNRPLCEAVSAKDPGKCGTDYACIMNYSVTMRDPNPCSRITDAIRSKACTSATLRSDRCADLQFDSQKNLCYELYAIYADDYTACMQITGDNAYSLECFSYFAARLRNLSICEQDSLSLDSLWACYTNYSLMTGDKAGCAKIDALATTSRFTCSFEYAKKWGDPSACEMITDTLEQRDSCYLGSIMSSNQNLDWRHCADVVKFQWQNKCYSEAAKLTSNISLCDRIQADYAIESCKDSYAANKTAGG
jgi:hypothetical protein